MAFVIVPDTYWQMRGTQDVKYQWFEPISNSNDQHLAVSLEKLKTEYWRINF